MGVSGRPVLNFEGGNTCSSKYDDWYLCSLRL
jgi:hypothetical protein